MSENQKPNSVQDSTTKENMQPERTVYQHQIVLTLKDTFLIQMRNFYL